MKKATVITISLMLIILNGCQGQSQKNNTPANTTEIVASSKAPTSDEKSNSTSENVVPAQVDLKKLQDVGTSAITEDDDYIYYCAKDGMYRLDKKSKKDELFLKQENSRQLLLDGDFIYFTLNEAEEKQICRVDKRGNNFMKVFSGKLNTKGAFIGDFFIGGNKLIIGTAPGYPAYSYDMTSKEMKQITDDVSFFQLHKGYLYYNDHAEKTFTIYRKNLNESKAEIVLGQGVNKPESNVYYNFIFLGEDMFYSAYKTTGKYGLYCYSNGKSSTINDQYNGRIYDLSEYKGNIYYSVDTESKDKNFMKYDIASKTESQIGVLMDYRKGSPIKIINGFAYYYISDGSIKTIQVK
jgi:hypothetical protein